MKVDRKTENPTREMIVHCEGLKAMSLCSMYVYIYIYTYAEIDKPPICLNLSDR